MNLPWLRTSSETINRAYRTAIGDLVGNIQPFQDGLLERPEPCILAGLEYDTPWTRDAAINVWNGAGLLFPDVSRSTLLSVVEGQPDGPIIGGQYWDAIIWTTGAWAYYTYTGDRTLLELAFQATRRSLVHFETTEWNPTTGLFRGPACYGDGVAAYPDRYANTGGSSSILDWPAHNPAERAPVGAGIPMQALSTNLLYWNAYRLMGQMAGSLGQPADPAWQYKAGALGAAIQRHFWDEARGQFRYLVDDWGGSDHQEGLGSSFAILFGFASPGQARRILHSQHITPFGIPCVWPAFQRYTRHPDGFGRHSGTVWPHVQGFWAEAAARSGATESFAVELFRLAELAARDGMFAEIYHPRTGAVYGGLQEGRPGWSWHSCRRQTWSATAFLRMVLFGLLGMEFSPEGLSLHPLLPEGLDRVELRGLPYRGRALHITAEGQGARAASILQNGRPAELWIPAGGGEGGEEIEILIQLA